MRQAAPSRWRAAAPTLLAALLGLGLLGGSAWLQHDQSRSRDEALVREALAGLGAQLQAVTEASFSATANLEALIVTHEGELGESLFRSSVGRMLDQQPQLRNVAAAPGDVIAYLHPLEPNRAALGLDYRRLPPQWAQIERARQLGVPLIFAPVQLVQGGQGVVQRRPVLLPTADGQAPRYWGSISAVADLDRFVQRAGLPQAPIRVALYERRADGQPGARIWGDTGLSARSALRADLKLPGAQWLMLGQPRAGWAAGWWQQPQLAGMALLVLGLLGTTALTTRRRQQLQQRSSELAAEVEARRASQAEAEAAGQRLRALLATASDWYWEQDAELRLSFVAGSGSSGQGERLQGLQGTRRWEQPDLVPGQPGDEAWQAHRAQLARQEPFRDFEYAMQTPGDSLRWLSVSGDPVFDAQGRFAGYRGTGRDVTALRQLHDTLIATRDQLQAVLDSATEVALVATDLNGRITEFSRGAERLLGYEAAQVLGCSTRQFHDPEELAQRATQLSNQLGRAVSMREVFTALLPSQGATPQAWTWLTAGGERVPVSLAVSELRDRSGALRGYLGVAVDLRAQLAAQRELRDTAQRLQAVLDSAEDVTIVAIDAGGRVRLFNRGAERMLGVSAAEAIGHSPRRFHLQAELDAATAELSARLGRELQWHEVFERQAAGLDGGHTRIWTYVRRSDGAHIKVAHTFQAMRDAQGRIDGYLAFARDVTAQHQAQQQLLEARDRLQAVFDAALDVGIVVISPDGRVTLFNRGAERMFGYREAEVLGRHTLLFHDAEELRLRCAQMAAELGHPVEPAELFMQPLRETDTTLSHWIYVRKTGERFPGALRLSRTRGRDGRVSGFLAVTMDVTAEHEAEQALQRLNIELEQRVEARTRELVQVQDELLRSERLAALGSLVAGVAHDLNTPLGTCLTAASALNESTQALQALMASQQLKRSALEAYAQQAQAATALLLRSLKDASELVTHFKQVSVDQTSAKRRRFRLQAVVDDVLSVMRPQLKGSRIRIEADIALDAQLNAELDSYPGELGRLLSNLIQNAQLHAFEPERPGLLRVQARPLDDTQFELEVSDDGRGMSEEVRRRAFDPFFTTKLGQGGSGLGLNIVHTIATVLLGGSVSLHSSPGAGSRFVFRLPYEAPRREGSSSSPALL